MRGGGTAFLALTMMAPALVREVPGVLGASRR